MSHVLIIDDDPDICLLLDRFLQRNNYKVSKAFTAKKGLSIVEKENIDLVLSDFRLPDAEGMDLLKDIKKKKPELPVIIITGYSDVKVAINCIKQGAFDYVTKPIHPEEILVTIKKALDAPKLVKPAQTESAKSAKSTKSKKAAPSRKAFVQGNSPQSMQVKKLTDLVGPTNMSVIITGETGTGKEYVARSIHDKSSRANQPFVALDCGALPKEIAASELFGHKKGSFTGALADKIGAFEMANGGTLFLDEVANLTYENQVKLLRVLQERKIRRIGDTKDISVDVRIVAATNEDLWTKAQKGDFREDLYHRLNEFSIQLSPLRERQSEIIQFGNHFVETSNQELAKQVEGFTAEAKERIENYYWHGNLRELKNVMKRAVLLADDNKIDTAHLPMEIVNPSISDHHAEVNTVSLSGPIGTLKEVAENAERQAIIQVLKRTAYNKTKTADILGVDRKTLYNKIKSYGISLKR